MDEMDDKKVRILGFGLVMLVLSIILIKIAQIQWQQDEILYQTTESTMLLYQQEIEVTKPLLDKINFTPTLIPLTTIPTSTLIAETTLEVSTEPVTEVPVVEVPAYDESDLRLLASIIYAEAGNQCYAGKQAVAIVVMNRVNCSWSFADSIQGVIYEKNQFQPVRNGALDRSLAMYDAGEMLESCISAAKYALDGNTTIVYKDVEYEMCEYLFFNTNVTPKAGKLIIQDHGFRKTY